MTPNERLIDPSTLHHVLRQDPETGHLFRLLGCGRMRADKPAGKVCKDGYRRISVHGRSYSAHRIAWAMHHGSFPESDLDHINRLRDDNRIENLREVTSRQNNSNRGRDQSEVGTTYIASLNKWQAQIKCLGASHYLGCFDTQAEARAAYLGALAVAERVSA